MNQIQRVHAAGWLIVLGAGLLATMPSPARATVFAFRENVNVMNSDLVSISPTGAGTSNPNVLIPFFDQPGFWEGGTANLANDVFTINLGQVENVKTIKMGSEFNPFMIANATVETATSLAGPWTAVGTSVSNPDSQHFTQVLNTAVDTQFLRISPTAYQGAATRFVFNNLRIFGDSGASLASGTHLDVIAANAYGAGGLVPTITGSGVSFSGDFVDDQQALIARRVIFNGGTGDSITIGFNQTLRMRELAVNAEPFIPGHDSSPTFHWQLLGSSDGGVTFPTVLMDFTGVEPSGLTYFDLNGFTGTSLKLNILNSTSADLRFSDFFVFEDVPEPSTVLLLAVGGLIVRRQFRARG